MCANSGAIRQNSSVSARFSAGAANETAAFTGPDSDLSRTTYGPIHENPMRRRHCDMRRFVQRGYEGH